MDFVRGRGHASLLPENAANIPKTWMLRDLLGLRRTRNGTGPITTSRFHAEVRQPKVSGLLPELERGRS